VNVERDPAEGSASLEAFATIAPHHPVYRIEASAS